MMMGRTLTLTHSTFFHGQVCNLSCLLYSSVCTNLCFFPILSSYPFYTLLGTKNYLGFYKKSFNNYFLYADYSPSLVNGVIDISGVMNKPSSTALTLTNGWNACSMSYGSHPLPVELRDIWSNNTCIATSGSKFFSFNSCDETSPNDGGIPLFSFNTYASDDNTYSMTCGKSTWTLAEAQAVNVDTGSVLVNVPSTADIISAAHELLKF